MTWFICLDVPQKATVIVSSTKTAEGYEGVQCLTSGDSGERILAAWSR
jgi:hypothetical protein